jgi:hypothetical protein
MAISRPITAAPTIAEERTWRANIETPRGQEATWGIQVYREVAYKDEWGNYVGASQTLPPIHRLAADVSRETVTLSDGRVLEANDIFEALMLYFDGWSAEDAAKPPVGPNPIEPLP